jgi:hypothetical protein
VAHLLFHRHCSKVAKATKEIISSIPLTLEPGELPLHLNSMLPYMLAQSNHIVTLLQISQCVEPKVPFGTPRVPSKDQRDEQEIVLQPSQ